jgi:hypothetical protein
MKFTRYIVVAVGVVALLATIAWFLRDSLIQRLSNPLLQDYGISIVNVSLDALATRDASIAYLELRHQKGTTIVVEDLTLPFAADSKKTRTYRARKVSVITATRMDEEAFDMAELIQQILSLPAILAGSVFVVDEFSVSPYPGVSDVRWVIQDQQQRMDVSIDAIELSANLTRAASGGHDVAFSLLPTPASSNASTLTARLLAEEAHLSLQGGGALDLPAWQPLAELVGIVPADIEIASGMATLAFDVAIPNNAAQTPTLSAELLATSPLELNYRNSDGSTTAVHFQSDDSANLSATFPDVDWSLGLTQASVTISYGDWKNIPVSLSEVTCKAGPTCSMTTRVVMSAARLPVGKVGLLEITATENFQFPDTGLHVDVLPGATLAMNDFASGATGAKRMRARLVSGAALDLEDAGWRIAADSVDAEIDTLSLGDAASVSLPLFLEKVVAGKNLEGLSLVSGIFAPSSRAIWDKTAIALPGVKGRVSLSGSDVAADLQTVGLQQEAAVKARHDLTSGTGRMSLGDAAISFGKKKLSDRVSPWPRDRDIVAGTAALVCSANWTRKKNRFLLNGEAAITATKIAGYFGETAFTGVSTRIRGTYRESVGFNVEPSTVAVALVEVGVPLERLSADYSLDLNAFSADVKRLSMSAFGGVVTAEPFSFRTDSDVNTVTLNTEALDLTELLSLKGFEAVEVTGSVGARLPITIEGGTITIANGALTGNAPGGVIRYKQESPPDKSDTSGLGFAKRVLSNFEYTTLQSDVNLSKEGDLVLMLKLTGRNPDMDEKRPVVLNLGVENNIPQMLRSLRAARAVEDVLEKRLGR